jgi:DNA-binding HxlR family transcriptional regulator
MLDKIDDSLLGQCESHPDVPLNEIVKPFLSLLSEKQLRDRLNRLEVLGYVKLDRVRRRGRVYCSITEFGKEALGRIGRPEQEP